KSWLKEGLNDRAVTRDLKWGVPVPLEEAENKVLYVWFDAPIGYISATKEWAAESGDPELWKRYWQDEDASLVHFIGKDNIVFHCIMFPLMLMKHGDYVLPDKIPANEFLNLEGKKLSTSRGWAVWLEEYLEEFEADMLRFVLGSTLPETKDSDFSWKDFQTRVNSELADILGNFIFRTVSFTGRFFDGRVPRLQNPGAKEKKALSEILQARKKIETAYESFRFREAIAETMKLARAGNKYFTETEPWRTRSEDPEACGNTLYVSLQISAALSVLFSPVMPHKMEVLSGQLNLPEKMGWGDVSETMLKAGAVIQPGEILFTKIEDDKVQKELERLNERSGIIEKKKHVPLKKAAAFSDFANLDFRVGEILHAEPVSGSGKLLQLTVDLGFETRTILSGIQKQFKPEEITGKKVCVVANLEPKKMMGIESSGMVLMAEDQHGQYHFLSTEADNGSPVF
ncbi:MAG: methionine--tRNA ligase subunit beta, partial [Balneolaceae bacterium]